MSKSGTRTFFFFWPGFHAETVGPFSWAETILARMATARTTTTSRAPPIAAPMIVPVLVAAGGAAATPAANAST